MHCGSVMDSLSVYLSISKIVYTQGRRQLLLEPVHAKRYNMVKIFFFSFCTEQGKCHKIYL